MMQGFADSGVSGSRSRCHRMIWRDCACCAIARLPAWTSLPANMDTICVISGGCCRPGAVDVLQADATRCAGFTEFLKVDALCEAHCMPLSSHCAPILHLHACCASSRVRHMEYFHDHVRIASLLFDGRPIPRDGMLRPDLSRPGLGLEFKHADAQRYAI